MKHMKKQPIPHALESSAAKNCTLCLPSDLSESILSCQHQSQDISRFRSIPYSCPFRFEGASHPATIMSIAETTRRLWYSTELAVNQNFAIDTARNLGAIGRR